MPDASTADSRLPLLVGMAGKRRMAEDDSCRFVERFRSLVERLDMVAETTPKILLCGGAAGADILAAETVLEQGREGGHAHPLWSVAIVLPLPQALFEQDFTGPHAGYLTRFHALLGDRHRVICKELRPLRQDECGDERAETALRVAVPLAQLDRSDTAFVRAQRHAHYEQLAIWLARQSGIFIAACPEADLADDGARHRFAPGSTERSLAIRRTGFADHDALAVIRRSLELPMPDAFEDPRGAAAFWIDPTTPAAQAPLPARLLAPLHDIFDVRPGHMGPGDAASHLMAIPWRQDLHVEAPPSYASQQPEAWRLACALPHGLERFNRTNEVGSGRWHGCAAGFGAEHPVAYLARLRPSGGAIGHQQRVAAAWLKCIQRSMALLFLAAIAMEETYTELLPENPLPLALYLGSLLIIALLVGVSAQLHLQQVSEDYRGLSEMFRVQLAWWSAGIGQMADRVHMRRSGSDLTRLRDAAACVSMWALLRFDRTRQLDIKTVNDACKPPHAGRRHIPHFAAWVDGQAAYFYRKSRLQFQVTAFSAAAFSATLRATFGSLALLLGAVLAHHVAGAAAQPLLGIVFACAERFADPALALCLLVCLGWLGFVLCGTAQPETPQATGGPLPTAERHALLVTLACVPPVGGAAAVLALAAAQARAWQPVFSASVAEPVRPGYGLALLLLGSAGVTAMLFLLGWTRALEAGPARARRLVMRTPVGWVTAISAILLVATLYGAASSLALDPVITSPGIYVVALKNWLLTCTTVLLATSGMIRWYSESRNHLTQAVHYDDLLRAFRRGQEIVRRMLSAPEDPVLNEDGRRALYDLGELALAENEAWLRAHRQKPLEAMG